MKEEKPRYAPPKKLKSWEREYGKEVFGMTIIDHNVRLSLMLTPTEYVFLDFIRTWQLENPSERILYSDLWINTGIKREMVPRLWNRCQVKGMVVKQPNGIVVTSEKWNEAHADVFEQTQYQIEKNRTKEVDLSFVEIEGFKELLLEFFAVRREMKKPVKTKRNAQGLYNKLLFHSQGKMDLARKVLDQSLDRGWLDFYTLQDDNTKPVFDGTKMVR